MVVLLSRALDVEAREEEEPWVDGGAERRTRGSKLDAAASDGIQPKGVK
jgi:hypothetical protein